MKRTERFQNEEKISDSPAANNARIAKNVIYLYLRMILLMAVSLYTSRIVLATLGIDDYGIYNVVGGFIGMFGFLNGAMSGSTQRFITFALGKGDKQRIKKVFSTCMIAHGLIALLIFVLAETVGLWFVLEKLVIPANRMTAAMVVYQCSVASTIVLIMSFPYNANIIAHERMSAFAYISIFEAFANLGIVFLLHIGTPDKLMLYAILYLVTKIVVVLVYRHYNRLHFPESRFHWFFDKQLLKEMLSFTGWNLWGGIAGTLMGQGINVLLNIFFGPAINAARGIAVQVQSAVQMFAVNFQTALNPQIMTSYASGDMQKMHMLLLRSAKFSFMLLLCLMLPLILEINFVLNLWLKEVPAYTNVFVILMLCISMIDAVSNPFMTASAATGHVKIYQSVVGGILISIVPFSYLALKLGAAPYAVFLVHLAIAIVAFFTRLFIVRNLIKLSIRSYISKVIVPCFYVAVTSIILSVAIKNILPDTTASAVLVTVTTAALVGIVSMLLGLTDSERKFVLSKVPLFKKKQ